MKVEAVPIDKINPAPYNPRLDLKPGDSDYEKLKKSINEFDMVEPLVWNKRTKNLVGGHQRLKILIERGDTEVEVSVVDLDENKEKALNLALNKISGEWDYPRLKDLLEELDTGDFDMEITGFDIKEIEDLMTRFHVPEDGLTDDDAVPEAVESKSVRDDLWSLGNHRLLCGDATVITDVERLMGGEKVEMVFTDPPYDLKDIKGAGIFKEAVLKVAKDIEHISTFDPKLFLGILVSLFQKGTMNAFIFCNKDLIHKYLDFAVTCGYSYNILTWHKTSHIPLSGSHHYPDTEYLIYLRKKSIFNSGLSSWHYRKYFILNNEKSEDHPTIKPVEIIGTEIEVASRLNGIVLDLFGGSGSTLIACEKLGRRCFMMEIDEHYCDVIIKRYEDYTGKQAVRIDGN